MDSNGDLPFCEIASAKLDGRILLFELCLSKDSWICVVHTTILRLSCDFQRVCSLQGYEPLGRVGGIENEKLSNSALSTWCTLERTTNSSSLPDQGAEAVAVELLRQLHWGVGFHFACPCPWLSTTQFSAQKACGCGTGCTCPGWLGDDMEVS